MVRGALAVVLAALAGGCTLGPDYSRPELSVPGNHRGIVEPPAAASLADLPWWELFRDPALQELIRQAIESNFDLRIAAARVEEARAHVGIARSALYPHLSAGGSAGVHKVSREGQLPQSQGDRTFQNWFLGFGLVWEIDLFGRIRRETEAATATFLATEHAQRGVLITLIADVAQSYFSLRELDLELEISQRTLRVNDERVEFYRKRLAGGASNLLELDQAVANRSRTAAAIPELERLVTLQENSINLLLGRSPGTVPRGAPLTEQYHPPTVPAGLPSALLERRPDVKAAEELLVAANANVGAAKAMFFPTISLTSVLGAASSDLSKLSDGTAAIWSLTGSVFQPLFEGGRITSNYEAAIARFEQAVAQYQKTAQNGFREVADALVTIDKLATRRAELETSVRSLADAARLSRLRYDTGLANYLEVLIADQQLFDAELFLARTRGSQFAAVANLYRALGGGWQ